MNAKSFLKKIKKVNLQRGYIPPIVTLLFFLFFFTFFTPIYETNDDVFFTLIANGYYTKTPTPYFQITSGMQTMHIVVSKLLVFLYTLFLDFNWYSFLMYSLAFLGLYALLIPIFQKIKNRFTLGLCLILLLLFVIRIFLFLSFTSIAAIGTMGGVFLLLFVIENVKHRRNYFLLAIVLLASSQLVRQSSFVMILLFSFPLVLQKIVFNNKRIIFFLIFLFFIVTSVVLVRQTNIYAYRQDKQWNEKMDFLLPLGTFFYEPHIYKYETNREVYHSLGWSKNDYEMFSYFFYDDRSIFTAKKLQTLLSSKHSSNIDFQSLIRTPLYFIVLIFSNLGYSIITILFFIIAWPNISDKDKKYVLSTMVLVIMAMLYFIYKGYIPLRVTLSMLFFVSYMLLFSISNAITSPNKTEAYKFHFKYVFIFSFIIVLSFSLFVLSNNNKNKIKNFKNIMNTFPKYNSLVFIWGSSIPYQWEYVFSTNSEFKNINFLIGSWTERTPLNDSIKETFSIKDLASSLYQNRNLYLVANRKQQQLLQTFLKEHKNIKVTFRVLYDYSHFEFSSRLLKVERKN